MSPGKWWCFWTTDMKREIYFRDLFQIGICIYKFCYLLSHYTLFVVTHWMVRMGGWVYLTSTIQWLYCGCQPNEDARFKKPLHNIIISEVWLALCILWGFTNSFFCETHYLCLMCNISMNFMKYVNKRYRNA